MGHPGGFYTKPIGAEVGMPVPLLRCASTQACRILHGSPVSKCGIAGLQECDACTRVVSLLRHCPFPCRSHPSSGRRWDALGKASAAHNKDLGQQLLTPACATIDGMC